MKDGSSLVVTLSSIPSFATCGLDVDLSSEESEDILKDPEDEPVLKKKISDSDEEESASPKTEFVGMCFFCFLSIFFSFLFLLSSLFLPVFYFFYFYFYFYFYIYICVALYCNLPFICMSISLFLETFEGLVVAVDVGVPSAAPPATPIAFVYVVPSVSVSVLPTTPIIIGPGEFPFPLSPFSFLLCEFVLFGSRLLISCLVLS